MSELYLLILGCYFYHWKWRLGFGLTSSTTQLAILDGYSKKKKEKNLRNPGIQDWIFKATMHTLLMGPDFPYPVNLCWAYFSSRARTWWSLGEPARSLEQVGCGYMQELSFIPLQQSIGLKEWSRWAWDRKSWWESESLLAKSEQKVELSWESGADFSWK